MTILCTKLNDASEKTKEFCWRQEMKLVEVKHESESQLKMQ